jgi:hypothetical protein
VAIEHGLNDPALHAASASVDEPDFGPANLRRRVDVIGYDGWNVARRERVQVELALEWNVNRLVIGHSGRNATTKTRRHGKDDY